MDWDSYLMEGPNQRYFTLPPPDKVGTSTANQVLDHAHQQKFRRAVLNVLSTSIAEQTLAQIVVGLPLKDVAFDKRYHNHYVTEPVFNHTELRSGVLEKTIAFCEAFQPLTLEIPSRVLHCYQNEPAGSRASRLPFVELVAVAIHFIAAELFKLDTSMHKGDKWPSDDYYESLGLGWWVTRFSVFEYADTDRYPDGVADVVAYWAEDRIFGGVILFGRGETGTSHEDMWFHSQRENLTDRVYALEDGQIAKLLHFLDSDGETLVGSECPLPILGDRDNRRRIDSEIEMLEFKCSETAGNGRSTLRNHSEYQERKHCVR